MSGESVVINRWKTKGCGGGEDADDDGKRCQMLHHDK